MEPRERERGGGSLLPLDEERGREGREAEYVDLLVFDDVTLARLAALARLARPPGKGVLLWMKK